MQIIAMLTSILHYCTIDFNFLEVNLNQLNKFSDEIIIPICDHLFEGEPENELLLHESIRIINEYNNARYIIFKWQGKKQNPGYYHNLTRKIGTDAAKDGWLLFVDADEILDDNFKDWFDINKNNNNAYWLTAYWYFREPTYRATTTEGAGLLIKKKQCIWNVNIRKERQQLFNIPNFIDGSNQLIGYNGIPMMHHYSWVASKENMILKVKNWGHRNDKSWVELIENEFLHFFNGKDFIHDYNYNIVDNKFNLKT